MTDQENINETIEVFGAKAHNLKDVNVSIPRNKLVVVTGLSGSGKSSLAFDTIYAEGQRRYLETYSSYIRQFLGGLERPDVDKITGLSPVIAIEQKTVSKNPRSTVGTITELYDFLRLLFSRVATAYSFETGKPMIRYSRKQIVKLIQEDLNERKLIVLAPLVSGRKGHYRELFEQYRKQGFLRVRVDGEIVDISPEMRLDRYKIHDIELVVDRIRADKGNSKRLSERTRPGATAKAPSKPCTVFPTGGSARASHLPTGTSVSSTRWSSPSARHRLTVS